MIIALERPGSESGETNEILLATIPPRLYGDNNMIQPRSVARPPGDGPTKIILKAGFWIESSRNQALVHANVAKNVGRQM